MQNHDQRSFASAPLPSTPAPALTAETVAMLDAVGRPAPPRDARGRFVKGRRVAQVSAQGEVVMAPPSRPELPAEPDTAAVARGLHLRRQREAAAEHGAAMCDALARPWLDADRVFGLQVDGDCCAPHILDGGAVHVDREARPVAGDFVAIFYETVQDGRRLMRGWVKRLSWNIPDGFSWPHRPGPMRELAPVLVVESLNPPRRYMLDVTKVHAVFKVVTVLSPSSAKAAPGYTAPAGRSSWCAPRSGQGGSGALPSADLAQQSTSIGQISDFPPTRLKAGPLLSRSAAEP